MSGALPVLPLHAVILFYVHSLKFTIYIHTHTHTHRVIKKDGLNFVRLHFLNYTWYVNDLHNI